LGGTLDPGGSSDGPDSNGFSGMSGGNGSNGTTDGTDNDPYGDNNYRD
jgi:hypothetical protein